MILFSPIGINFNLQRGLIYPCVIILRFPSQTLATGSLAPIGAVLCGLSGHPFEHIQNEALFSLEIFSKRQFLRIGDLRCQI